jgi:hypothetical protein
MSPGFTCAVCIIPESHSKPPLILFGIRFVPPQAQSFAAKTRAEGFDVARPTGQTSKSDSRAGGGSVGSKPQTPLERNRPRCGINAR